MEDFHHMANKKYEHDIKGFNSRLDEIQAAFLNIKLNYLNEVLDLRHIIVRGLHVTIPKSNYPQRTVSDYGN